MPQEKPPHSDYSDFFEVLQNFCTEAGWNLRTLIAQVYKAAHEVEEGAEAAPQLRTLQEGSRLPEADEMTVLLHLMKNLGGSKGPDEKRRTISSLYREAIKIYREHHGLPEKWPLLPGEDALSTQAGPRIQFAEGLQAIRETFFELDLTKMSHALNTVSLERRIGREKISPANLYQWEHAQYIPLPQKKNSLIHALRALAKERLTEIRQTQCLEQIDRLEEIYAYIKQSGIAPPRIEPEKPYQLQFFEAFQNLIFRKKLTQQEVAERNQLPPQAMYKLIRLKSYHGSFLDKEMLSRWLDSIITDPTDTEEKQHILQCLEQDRAYITSRTNYRA